VVRRVVLALVVLGGIAAFVAGGWNGLFVYAFLAAIAGGIAYGAGVGGGVVEGASRGRFDRDDRNR